MVGSLHIQSKKCSEVTWLDVFSTSLRRKTAYLFKVSTYSTITASLSVTLYEGLDAVVYYLPLLIGVPIIVSIPACFMTVHREVANEDLTRRLRDALAHDPLTKSHTRQALYDLFDAKVNGRVIAMIDVDHFKRINDSHGHLVGDQVLLEIAESIRSKIRDGDLLCRFGGEEFVVLLVDTSLDEALRVSNRIRTGLSENAIPTSVGPVAVTVSIGLTPVGPYEKIDDAIARADEALYRAKEGGRNRTELASRTLLQNLKSA